MTTSPSKTAASKAEKRKRTGIYLPALPTGWTYQTLIATGPNGGQVTVDASTNTSDVYGVTVVADDIEKRHSTVATLAEAAQSVKSGAKALAKITEAEEAARKAREEGLSALGDAGEETGGTPMDPPQPGADDDGFGGDAPDEADETAPGQPDASARL